MKKSVVMVAGVVLLAGAATAFAKVNGTIQSIDVKGDAIILNNGHKVHLPEQIEVETMKVGEKIVITYATDGAGKPVVESIRPAN